MPILVIELPREEQPHVPSPVAMTTRFMRDPIRPPMWAMPQRLPVKKY